MKQSMRRKVHTCSVVRRCAGPAKARNQGSVTLETALVLPLFLLFVVFLAGWVQTSVIAMSLQGALTQTVRLAASAWYPISLLEKQGEGNGPERSASAGSLSGVRETIGQYGQWLPAPVRDWAADLADGTWSLEEETAKAAFQRLAFQLADRTWLDEDRFRIVSVTLPGHLAEEAFLTLEAEYRLPFRVPFTGRSLSIRAQAQERVWTGGSPSRAKRSDSEGKPLNVKFMSLEPNPVRPGMKATLVLQTEPGAVLDLAVIYKSGQSQARNLGAATADATGKVSWTWHVSGNTTSGQWHWVVRSEGGSYSQPFEVRRKNE